MSHKHTDTPRPFRRGKQDNNPKTPRATLLTLPPELRNKIYHHILSPTYTSGEPTFSLLADVSSSNVFRPSPPQPPLAKTNRQVRHEVLSLFYGTQTFTIDRELGAAGLIATWAEIMRSSLWYLRSIKFELFSEYTAPCLDLEAELCDTIVVHAWLHDSELGQSIEPCVDSNRTCTCKFARCARDVERGILGSRCDVPLIRFLKAWDLPAPPVRGDRYLVCSGCGGGNLQVSWRDIRRRTSLPMALE